MHETFTEEIGELDQNISQQVAEAAENLKLAINTLFKVREMNSLLKENEESVEHILTFFYSIPLPEKMKHKLPLPILGSRKKPIEKNSVAASIKITLKYQPHKILLSCQMQVIGNQSKIIIPAKSIDVSNSNCCNGKIDELILEFLRVDLPAALNSLPSRIDTIQ